VTRGLLMVLLIVPFMFQRGLAQSQERFDHWQHRTLFPRCSSCHAGVTNEAAAVWPSAADCAQCHDGTIEAKVDWSPPKGPPRTNLRFTHGMHAEAVQGTSRPDSALTCGSCHTLGGERMQVRLAVVQTCLDCHGVRTAHLSAPDTSCGTCHVPLARAVRLTRKDVAEFPVPPSHKKPGFAFALHGQLARAGGKQEVSQACATCHAREFCSDCHVNAPEVPAIQALDSDDRSTAHEAELRAPPSHQDPDFVFRHGPDARKSPMTCATCHTQESCLACHVGRPASVRALPAAGPGRGKGADVRRARPASHGQDFSDIHGSVADSRPQSCEGCHVRPQCLDCHRPNPADATPGYHPAGFLTRHPASAYSRETNCSDCHNNAGFCADCHVNSGLSARGELNAGYHDARRSFLLGHGQAARQNLESCVACHAERDCLTCHSALGGRRFNPHGPGFDAATLRRKNSQTCTACHGAAIPESAP
jgi:Doubled CXXCH motif (Paired_CXXCH_1)